MECHIHSSQLISEESPVESSPVLHGLQYSLNDDTHTASVIKHISEPVEFVESFEHNSISYTVDQIGDLSTLTHTTLVTLPETIEMTGYFAFYSCGQLAQIGMNSNLR
jgi:hypothetical protein